ncbi:MAG: 4Fe-4S binding protein [Deltaproteobacteria bacterium]|nr:4Fe-4S binding protein [Deltaproteobacteria bacterium]
MSDLELYKKLAERFDTGQIVGAPMTESLLKILMLMFNPEEAEVALTLPFQNTHLDDVKTLYPEKSDRIEEILDTMAMGGTVFRDNKPGAMKRYRLLPSLVGWAETPIWHGKPTQQAKDLAPLWNEYRKEAFSEEMARGMPLMRVIPIDTSLKDNSEVLPFDVIRPMVEATTYQAVAHCPCRLNARYRDKGCDYSTENCLHFGSMGRYMVEHGLAREINKEETLEILKSADDEGLVHIINNMEGHVDTICNCCGCCCAFLVPINENMGLDILSYSNYLARVDSDECVGCGTCEERCPMDAIEVIDEVAAVDESVCIGCGICTPACDTEAIRLVLREAVKPPPQPMEFMEARLK